MKTLFRIGVILGVAVLVVWALVAVGGQRLLLSSSRPSDASDSPQVLISNGQGVFTAEQSAARDDREAIWLSFEHTMVPIAFVIVIVSVAGRALSSPKSPRKQSPKTTKKVR